MDNKERNYNFSIVFRSVDEYKQNSNNEKIFNTIDECNDIKLQQDLLKSFLYEDKGDDSIIYTRT